MFFYPVPTVQTVYSPPNHIVQRCPIVSQRPPLIFSPHAFSISLSLWSFDSKASMPVSSKYLFSFYAFVKEPEKLRIPSDSLYCMTFLFLWLKESCRSYGQAQLRLNFSLWEVDRFLSLFHIELLPKFISVISKKQWCAYSVSFRHEPPFWVLPWRCDNLVRKALFKSTSCIGQLWRFERRHNRGNSHFELWCPIFPFTNFSP